MRYEQHNEDLIGDALRRVYRVPPRMPERLEELLHRLAHEDEARRIND